MNFCWSNGWINSLFQLTIFFLLLEKLNILCLLNTSELLTLFAKGGESSFSYFFDLSQADLSSLTRDWTHPSYSARVESYPLAVRALQKCGREELPYIQGQGQRPKEQPHVQEWRLRGLRRAERSYSTFKVGRGGHEEIPLVQGKGSGCALLEQPWRDTSWPG